MRRLVHLSDLHFGRERPEVLKPLKQAVNDLAPDLVIISGDFTQRATEKQFAAAAAFLQEFQPPTLSVPGNHDVPLHNLFIRLFQPWHRYRRWINADLQPRFFDDEMLVIGVNTVNPFAWQRGWFRSRAMRRVCAAFNNSTGVRTHLVVAHHPLQHAPGEAKSLMRGAENSLRRLRECGVDAVLSGHLHSWRAEPFVFVDGLSSALQIHSGTTLSNRLRGEINDFNLLEIEKGRITVIRYAFNDDTANFLATNSVTFHALPGGWR